MPDLLDSFSGVRRAGAGWSAKCPAHDDHRASLSISQSDDGTWLVKCHAGCDVDAVLAAANLELRDLFPTSGTTTGREIVATYDYPDMDGVLRYQVVRFQPKDFRQRRPNGHGGWTWSTKGLQPLLYRRPDLQGREVVLAVEGEKDVDRLWDLSLPATCNHGGAGKWSTHTAQLVAAGVKRVVVIPDADDPGQKHGRTVAQSCVAAGLTVKLVTLPDGAKDVSAYLDAAGTKATLTALIQQTATFEVDIDAPRAGPVVHTLSDVTAQSVHWLWPRRIARGKLGILAGEPGEGKSTMTLDLAARLTRPGGRMPDGVPAPDGAVLLLSAEDGLADTIRPRLDACGADVRRVHALTATRDLDGTEHMLELGRDLPQLETAIERYSPALVIIDPLSAYLGRADTWRDNEVRALLSPLASLAEHHDCAIPPVPIICETTSLVRLV